MSSRQELHSAESVRRWPDRVTLGYHDRERTYRLREAFDAGARHALEEASVAMKGDRQVAEWLRARALAVGDNRNQED